MPEKKTKKKIEELEFVRTYGLTHPYGHVPRELFEQAKEMDAAAIDRAYSLNFTNCPLTLLYIMVDPVNKIKGVLWANVDFVEARFFIRLLSVDAEYQSKGLLEKVKQFLFGLEMGPDLKKEIHFLTARPRAYEKVGCVRSKQVLMEIKQNGNDKDTTERDDLSSSPDGPPES